MQFQPARLADGDQAAEVGDGDIGPTFAQVDRPQTRMAPRHEVTLEEALTDDAVRCADDGDGPVEDVGQQAFGHRLVIEDQVGLADGGVVIRRGPQNLVGVRDAYARDDHVSGLGRGWLRGGGHVGGRLVLAQALKGGLTQEAVLGIARVFDLGDQDGNDPVHLVLRLGRGDEGRAVGDGGLQRRQQEAGQGRRIAGADPTQVAQPVFRLHTDQQRAEAGSVLGRPAADHHLVAAPALGLDPCGGATGAIGRVELLGDDAFQPHATGTFQNRCAPGGEMVGVAQARGMRFRHPVAPGPQPRLAVRQGQGAQVLGPVEQQVEGEVDQTVGLLLRDGGLQRREIRQGVLVQGAQLAVEHRVGPVGGVRGQFGKAVGPVQPLAGAQDRPPAAGRDLDSIAVELDLVRPARRRGRTRGDLA